MSSMLLGALAVAAIAFAWIDIDATEIRNKQIERGEK